MRKISLLITGPLFYLVFVFCFSGCGYTTRLINPQYEGKTVYVEPAVNGVSFTGEMQEFSQFRSVPPLIEVTFTKELISRFNLDGNLRTARKTKADFTVECEITDYVRNSIRHDDQDNVEEYQLVIYYSYKFRNNLTEEIKTKSLISTEEYALEGSEERTEAAALDELLEDAARRVVEDIVEAW